MPILTRAKPRPATVLCVREVRAGIPSEVLEEIRRFYTSVLGLEPWPPESQFPGGWGVGNPHCGLYLQFQHDPVVHPVRRRFTLTVDALAALEERLSQLEWPHERIRGFGWSDQYLLLHDPAGHLIEVRQSNPF
jgi:catechol 2,3-dioxygenase-like lactoylglutathione lyase family enzyme